MSTITKDQIFEIHDSLVNAFAKDPKSQALLKKYGFTTAQIEITSLMITEALRQYHTLLTGEILP